MFNSKMIRTLMVGLVERAGGVEPAAALIGARLGTDVSKGTISRRNSGQLSWPLEEIMALEDALGDQAVRRWLFRTVVPAQQETCLMSATTDLVRESGEAGSAVLAHLTGQGSKAAALKEVLESIEANQKLLKLLEGGND